MRNGDTGIPFDSIRKIDQHGQEYWSSRDMARLLGYTEYGKFLNALRRAEKACEGSGEVVSNHFAHVSEMVTIGSGAKRAVNDVHLSRYACYLLVENADPSKPVVALGQAYFAIQTRRQELENKPDFAALPENQKRLILRSQLAVFNRQLAEAAQRAGVVAPRDFQQFQDHGYMGLYSGLNENEIHRRKHLKPRQRISDFMGSEELGANIFRATQTDAKLRRDRIQGKDQANQTHYEVGRKVRQTIQELGGTMPENLPKPEKSIQQLQKEEQKRLDQQLQPRLFDIDGE